MNLKVFERDSRGWVFKREEDGRFCGVGAPYLDEDDARALAEDMFREWDETPPGLRIAEGGASLLRIGARWDPWPGRKGSRPAEVIVVNEDTQEIGLSNGSVWSYKNGAPTFLRHEEWLARRGEELLANDSEG